MPNIAGGSDRSHFSSGLGYQYQDGIFGGPVKSDFRRFTMRLNLGASYKGFDFNATFYSALGQQVWRSWRKFTDGQYENYTTEVYDYWHGEGTSNKLPLLQPGNTGVNFQQLSDIFVSRSASRSARLLTATTPWRSVIFFSLPIHSSTAIGQRKCST